MGENGNERCAASFWIRREDELSLFFSSSVLISAVLLYSFPFQSVMNVVVITDGSAARLGDDAGQGTMR